MVFVIPTWICRTVTASACGFAVAKGSMPERIVGAVCGFVWLWDNFVHPYLLGQRMGYELAKDSLELAILIVLALRYDRWWLFVASMANLLIVATDVANMMAPLHPWAFGTAIWTWSYIRLAALAAGTWMDRSRRAGWWWRGRSRSYTPPEPRAGFAAGSGRPGHSSAG